ncbi:uncharacterized protein DNG_09815 [Cephalotrichum gorgonifer]|uniref:Uncharacterized protein n=1 Tax=Cephalotrichum gorgonifer TaxID=2041049 RepID=A0AAE8N6E3_9PEZI|nr:uncharacterized protein DNG_09815 [Cephalotrichum gorgonifer]
MRVYEGINHRNQRKRRKLAKKHRADERTQWIADKTAAQDVPIYKDDTSSNSDASSNYNNDDTDADGVKDEDPFTLENPEFANMLTTAPVSPGNMPTDRGTFCT